MARALWSGSLSFGFVNVPVQIVSAVRNLDLHFRQLHEKDKVPVETQRWCSEEGKEVPYEAITRSYELDDGKTVIVSDEDLEAVEPRKTRTIDIEQLVDLGEVAPIYFDHPWLVPAGDDEGAARAPTGCCSASWRRPTTPRSARSSCGSRSTWRSSARATAR